LALPKLQKKHVNLSGVIYGLMSLSQVTILPQLLAQTLPTLVKGQLKEGPQQGQREVQLDRMLSE
jgi:hypothetical protein